MYDPENYGGYDLESYHDTKKESSQDRSSHEDKKQDTETGQKHVDFLELFPDNFEMILKDTQKTYQIEQEFEHSDDKFIENDFSEENNNEKDVPEENFEVTVS